MFWVFSKCKNFQVRNRNKRTNMIWNEKEKDPEKWRLVWIWTSDPEYYNCPPYPLSNISNTFRTSLIITTILMWFLNIPVSPIFINTLVMYNGKSLPIFVNRTINYILNRMSQETFTSLRSKTVTHFESN